MVVAAVFVFLPAILPSAPRVTGGYWPGCVVFQKEAEGTEASDQDMDLKCCQVSRISFSSYSSNRMLSRFQERSRTHLFFPWSLIDVWVCVSLDFIIPGYIFRQFQLIFIHLFTQPTQQSLFIYAAFLTFTNSSLKS